MLFTGRRNITLKGNMKSLTLNKIPAIFVAAIIFAFPGFAQNNNIYSEDNGIISFRSEAPLELISASSKQLLGFLDIDKKTFSFRITIRTFQGFNSPLQKEHFHENYMESEKYPEASFKGKIIEEYDLSKEGSYLLRAKGMLTIHGIAQERIIKSDVTVKNNQIHINSNFTVLLSDHNIPIPIVVYKKLANEIKVEANIIFEPR